MMRAMMRLLGVLILLATMVGCRAAPLPDRHPLGFFDKRRAVESLDVVEKTLRQTTLVPADWFARVPGTRAQLQRATTQAEVRASLSQLLQSLNDPHYAILPTTDAQGEAVAVETESFVRTSYADRVITIRLDAFRDPEGSLKRVEEILTQHISANGVILDLRGNRGGIVGMAPGLAGYFMDGGSLGQLSKQGQAIDLPIYPRQPVFRGKVAIVADENTASAAEIFTIGMQRAGRARVFGSPTANSTRASAIIDLPNRDRFQYVVADYIAPAGDVNATTYTAPADAMEVARRYAAE
jgi:hypothetical protein